jgi:hypothetical protein
MTVITFSPSIGPVKLSCILSEDHDSTIEITGNPIETGAEVNDHAYIKPKSVVLDIADRDAAQTHAALVRFQESRVPFYLVTGLRLYKDMLVQSIQAYRDKDNHSILSATVTLREVIIVSTSGGSGSSSGSKSSGKPGGTKSRTATTPSKASSTNQATADRASGTVTRGDTPAKQVAPAKSQSLAKSIFT